MKARTALAALLAAAALGLAWRVRGELDDYRRRAARLRSDWRSIAGIAGPAPLRLHAQVREDAGTDRAPVVLVHGYGIGSSYFVPLAERLAGHVRVYAPDLPGHGRSDHDARPLGIAELGAALAAWMGARGLRGAWSWRIPTGARWCSKRWRVIRGWRASSSSSDPRWRRRRAALRDCSPER